MWARVCNDAGDEAAARTDLAICNVRDELVVYDFRNHQARCLNRMAAAVFKLCDGKRTPRQIAAELIPDLRRAGRRGGGADGARSAGRGRPLRPVPRRDASRPRAAPPPQEDGADGGAIDRVAGRLVDRRADAGLRGQRRGVLAARLLHGRPSGCCNNNGMAGTCQGTTCSGTNSTCNGQHVPVAGYW